MKLSALKSVTEVIEISVSGDKDAEKLEVTYTPSYFTQKRISGWKNLQDDDKGSAKVFDTLAGGITEWNLEDDGGKKIKVSAKVLMEEFGIKLSMEILTTIIGDLTPGKATSESSPGSF